MVERGAWSESGSVVPVRLVPAACAAASPASGHSPWESRPRPSESSPASRTPRTASIPARATALFGATSLASCAYFERLIELGCLASQQVGQVVERECVARALFQDLPI